MPGIASWPGHIPTGTETYEMVSTLDVLPSLLALTGIAPRDTLDGINILPILFQDSERLIADNRMLFFWRDGFQEGPLPSPYGRYDVVAAKFGRIKAWIYTKSSHYNSDEEVHHDPPLLFDVISDPAEANPLNPDDYSHVIEEILLRIKEHKETITWGNPLTVSRNPKYLPCSNRKANCRSHFVSVFDEIK
jgi:arylsulfatase A-like enzyme